MTLSPETLRQRVRLRLARLLAELDAYEVQVIDADRVEVRRGASYCDPEGWRSGYHSEECSIVGDLTVDEVARAAAEGDASSDASRGAA